MPVPDDADFVIVAEVVKAVGLRGEVKLFPFIDWHPPLLDSEFLRWDDGNLLVCRKARAQGQAVVIGLEGCRDRNQAENLVGRQIGFLRTDYLDPTFPRPPAGLPFRYLHREVCSKSGARVGAVSEVRRYGNQYMLVLLVAGREVLIPAVEPILRENDGLEGPLIIDPPEGLLDVAGD
ncbi:MAG: hypothetical protein ABIF77_06450 [bacterium]